MVAQGSGLAYITEAPDLGLTIVTLAVPGACGPARKPTRT